MTNDERVDGLGLSAISSAVVFPRLEIPLDDPRLADRLLAELAPMAAVAALEESSEQMQAEREPGREDDEVESVHRARV